MALDLATGVTLRLAFKAGRIAEYKMHTHMAQEVVKAGQTLGRQEYGWNAVLRQRTLAVEADGSGHVVTVNEPQGSPEELQVAGVPIQRQVVYTHMTPVGNIVETSGPDSGAAFSFPEEPVREGQEWTGVSKLQLPSFPRPLEAVTHYRLAGQQDIADFHCVKIEIRSEESSVDIPVSEGVMGKLILSSTGVLFFDPEKGVMVRQELHTRSVPHIADATYETITKLTQDLGRLSDP
ncbi:MAG: hypothetical protein AB1758_20305 [Candidatus Eremiobacterota bacterium]